MKNRELRSAAYQDVKKAIRRGELRPQSCARPGCPRTPTVAHHEDYARSLDVIWLCRLHHTWRHMGTDLDALLRGAVA